MCGSVNNNNDTFSQEARRKLGMAMMKLYSREKLLHKTRKQTKVSILRTPFIFPVACESWIISQTLKNNIDTLNLIVAIETLSEYNLPQRRRR